jgi:hypothetical protein
VVRRFERTARADRILAGLQGLSIVYLGAAALAGLFLASLDVPWVSAQTFQVTQPAVTSTQNKVENDGHLKVETAHQFVGYNSHNIDCQEVRGYLRGQPLGKPLPLLATSTP